MQRGSTPYIHIHSRHIYRTLYLKWLLKQNKQRNQFDLRAGGRKEGEKKTLQITVSIDFRYLFCELPGVWSSPPREREGEKVRKMRGGGGVKKSSGSEITGWLFTTQPCVKLIRQCVMPLIKSMAQATPNWYLPSKLTESMANFSFTYKNKWRRGNYPQNGPNCSLSSNRYFAGK